ncbi:MAG: hypothetical protein NC086_05845 [Alistipes sp.]|nr:hypothetical protein [Alistipes sp.]
MKTEGILFIAAILAVLVYTSIRSKQEQKRKTRDRIKREYSEPLERELEYEDYEALKSYFYAAGTEGNVIDDDTWEDLNMDEVYMTMNNTNSSVGREYLYSFLRKPCTDMEELERRHKIADGFADNEEERIKIQEIFADLGVARRIGIYSYLTLLKDYVLESNLVHYSCFFLLALSAVSVFMFRADISIAIVIASVAFIVITYYKKKAGIEKYFDCVKWTVGMIAASKSLCSLRTDFLKDELEELSKYVSSTKKVAKHIFLLQTGHNMSGSIEEMVMDYVRILTHADLIKFHHAASQIQTHYDEILKMYEILGYIESCIAIAAYRNKLAVWCVPKLARGNDYKALDLYHPLLGEPVANSICASRCVLLTGSNASGKSTFLRSAALNALLSQTICTGTASEYEGDFYRIVSSMSHKDSIVEGDSYYMVEIKALKRILDLTSQKKEKILCFLDEVLRGTNTVERIAASTQILKSFDGKNALCFAATHDIELTSLLADYYDNYHFDESFVNDDVQYSYRLETGPARSRNAIRLLKQMGYEEQLIDDANALTKKFEETGAWC